MHELAPVHGGCRDQGIHDLSTNANQLGPCPAVLSAVASADLTRYPDPEYLAARAALAARHGCAPGRVVVGAGASELILRLLRRHPGPVRVLGPTFSEYQRCARLEGYPCEEVREVSDLAASSGGLAFVCWPNNPTGDCCDLAELAAVSRLRPLVIDLAYADFVARDEALRIARSLPEAWLLHSPNKAFGLTGLRAGYVIAPEEDPVLEHLAPSWVLDAAGAAFLEASAGEAAQTWLDETRPQLHALRAQTASLFCSHGHEVLESPANFLMARVGDSGAFCAALRSRGVCVRDASSFGMPGWIRLAGAVPAVREIIADHLASLPKQDTLFR